MTVIRILGKIVRFHARLVKRAFQFYMRNRSLREMEDRLFSVKSAIIRESEYIDHVVMKDGSKFYASELIHTVGDVRRDYRFDDIRDTDIVIDLGACIGGFSIPASRKAKHVYAIEPMTPNLVRDNVVLNQRDNISVLEMALGDGQTTRVEWLGEDKTLETKTLTEIKEICGGCDFLKSDCEGYEWTIKPEELKGIRRVEMEVHSGPNFRTRYPIGMMEDMLKEAGFSCEVEEQGGQLWLIHARKKGT